jgi:hypothetical protein
MKEKKETFGYIIALIALIGCCLLLTTLLAGGTLAFIGVSLRNKWLLIAGIVVLIFAVVIFILKRRPSK